MPFLSDNVWAHKGNKFCHYEPIPKWDKKFLTRIQLLKIQFTKMFYDHKPYSLPAKLPRG